MLLILILLPLSAFAQTAQSDMMWVDQEIAAIKPPRKGVSPGALLGLQDPFREQLILNQPAGSVKSTVVRRQKSERPFTLEAVINSRIVLIDGNWYKQDQKVHGYTVQSIGKDSVMLQNKKKQIKLTLVKQNKNIKINAK